MRRFLVGLTILLGLGVAAPAYAQDLIFQTFGSYLDSLRVQAGIPGLSGAVVGGSSIVWEGAFGQQNMQPTVATQTDTSFHLDGITQVVSAALVLRCVEDGRLSLDDPVGPSLSDNPDARATLREVLTHTTAGSEGLTFAYRPERLASLTAAVSTCTGVSFRDAFSTFLDQLGMVDSVPGPDAVLQVPTVGFIPPIERYRAVLERLAVPYRVDQQGRPTASQYAVTTLTPASGLISTVRDVARFELALRHDLLLLPATRAMAWTPPIGHDGQPLPHGLGWFVQTYNNQPVVWQFGVAPNASSSMVVTLPTRGLTMILMANSDALARPFVEEPAGLTSSPFARLFLEVFTHQTR